MQKPQEDLTPRQIEILCALLEGSSNREIAARLGVREQTIKNQLSVMYEKLGVQNRLQLALEGMRIASVPSPQARS
jgi:two-component system, NarL family, nitrate/nitrite response regulator NarL